MSWLFGRKPKEPARAKQFGYAKKLGIEVTSKMSKADVSHAIANAERKNPKLKRQREHVNRSKYVKKHGKELVEAEDRWNQFAESTEYMLAIYVRGKSTIVDVLRVNGAFIDGRGKLQLEVEAPKLYRDRGIGDYLMWETDQKIVVDKLLHYEPLHRDFDDERINVYTKTVENGLKIAKKL